MPTSLSDIRLAVESSPYTAYYIPAGGFVNNEFATIISYTGDVMAQGTQFLSRQMISEFYGIKEHHEYSSITMGSEGSYMPIIFDEEWI